MLQGAGGQGDAALLDAVGEREKRTPIRVVNGPTGKYLRTDKDSTSKNNLDDLPDC